MNNNFSTPVLIIIFNRPDKVQRLMEVLSRVRPARLYVAADGPRANHIADEKKCREARKIATTVTWPCEIYTNFSDTNLGADPAVEKAIAWFFQNIEQGVILEDDCLPHPDFFRFANAMLERYKNENRIMMVSGNNFQAEQKSNSTSYYFSRYPNTWGWATWRRAWKHYDTKLADLPKFIESKKIEHIRPRKKEQQYWLKYFKSLYTGKHSPWDAKWVFTIWNNAGLSINPSVNLVQNIGFGRDSTHTRGKNSIASIKTSALPRPLLHPQLKHVAEEHDQYFFDSFIKPTFFQRLRYNFLKNI